MRITSKSEYGILAMLELANCKGGQPVSLVDVARRHGISTSYMELLFAHLRRAGLVTSRRGPRGGFFLARRAGLISIGDIVRAIEPCHDDPADEATPVDAAWQRFSGQVAGFLDTLSLAALLGTPERARTERLGEFTAGARLASGA